MNSKSGTASFNSSVIWASNPGIIILRVVIFSLIFSFSIVLETIFAVNFSADHAVRTLIPSAGITIRYDGTSIFSSSFATAKNVSAKFVVKNIIEFSFGSLNSYKFDMIDINDYLNDIKPFIVGGGMNYSYSFDGERVYNEMPYLLEAGTPNIAGIIGFSSSINYLLKIGMNNIEKYEKDLRKYALEKLKVENVKEIEQHATNLSSHIQP